MAFKGHIPWNKGIPFSEATREKISEALKGNIPWNVGIPQTKECKKKLSESHKGIIPWMVGKKHSEKSKLKISLNHADVSGKNNPNFGKHLLGKNSSNWKGGVTPENHIIRNSFEYKNWRKAVFTRDYWTCQMCGNKKGIKIHSHHIKPFKEYPKLRFEIDNGLTLCKKCHEKTFKKILVV